jgi:hypothetical protein
MTVCNILWPLGTLYGCYSLWSLCIFFPFWYDWTKKNLATLVMITIFTDFCQFSAGNVPSF